MAERRRLLDAALAVGVALRSPWAIVHALTGLIECAIRRGCVHTGTAIRVALLTIRTIVHARTVHSQCTVRLWCVDASTAIGIALLAIGTVIHTGPCTIHGAFRWDIGNTGGAASIAYETLRAAVATLVVEGFAIR